jgi:hypothetical protein
VVDPVGVALLEGGVDDFIEVAGGGEIGAEGFLDDDARPAAIGFAWLRPAFFRWMRMSSKNSGAEAM